MSPLEVWLLKSIGGLALSAMLRRASDIFSQGLIEKAIARTAKRLSGYPAIDHTLAVWASNDQVLAEIRTFVDRAGGPPVSKLRELLADAGFSEPEGGGVTSAEEVLLIFFELLEEEVLHSSSAQAYSRHASASEHQAIIAELSNLRSIMEERLPPVSTATRVLIRTSEDDPPDEFKLIRTLLKSQQPKSARAALEALHKYFDSKTTPAAWYFYHSFQAWCSMLEHKVSDARSGFLKAAEYWEDRPAAQRNIGVAELMLGHHEEAEKRADKAIALGAIDSDSVTLKAQAICFLRGSDEAADYINRSALRQDERNRLLGFIYHNDRKWSSALTHLRLARSAFPDDHELLIVMCSTIGAQLSDAISSSENVPPWVVGWLRRDLLTEAIDAANDACELLGGKEELCGDRDIALSLAASLKSLGGRYEDAKRDLDQIGHIEALPSGSVVQVLQAESRVGRTSDALAHARFLLSRDPTSEKDKHAYAEEFVAAHAAEETASTSDSPERRGPLPWELQLVAGQRALAGNRWEEAQATLEPMINPFAPRELVRMYLAASLNGRKYDKCLSLIADCRESLVVDEFILDVEVRALENLGDLDRAVKTVSEAEMLGGGKARWRLRRAVIERRRGGLGDALPYLPLLSDLKSLGMEDQRFAVSLLIEAERFEDALAVAYECLLRNFDNSDAHLSFVQLFLGRQREEMPFLEIESVRDESVVRYELTTGEKREVFLGQDMPPARLDHVTQGTKLFEVLIGKKKGESVTILADEYGDITASVTDVIHKYVWSYQDCMSRFNERFPGESGMRKIQVEGKDLSPLLKLTERASERDARLQMMYEQGGISISSIATLTGSQDHDVFFRMSKGEYGGVLACDGDKSHLIAESESFLQSETICLEMTSVYTLAALGALDPLLGFGKQLKVSRHVIDGIKGRIAETKRLDKRGKLSLGLQDGRPVVFSVDESQVQEFVRSNEEVLGWLEVNCEVCHRGARLHSLLARLEGAVSDSTLSTLALTSDLGGLLLTEDLWLRRMVQQEMQCAAGWAFSVLNAAKIKGLWQGDLEEIKVTLLHSKYRFLPLDEAVLTTAHRLDRYSVGANVEVVLRAVADPRMYPAIATQIVVDAVRHVWMTLQNALLQTAFLIACLEALARRGNWVKGRELLFAFMRDRFRLLPIQHREILVLVQGWETRKTF